MKPLLRKLGQKAAEEAQGWCSLDKTLQLMNLILRTKPKICVEIGIFGGASFLPICIAAKEVDAIAIGIDPWDTEASLEGTIEQIHRDWWSTVDFEAIREDFYRLLDKYKDHLPQYYIYQEKSEDAVNRFKDNSIDFLHIDGNHSSEVAYQDSKLYLPKVKNGGHIIFDDIDWPSTYNAVQFCLSQSEMIEKYDHRLVLKKPFLSEKR